jgi:hypothetical protein
VSDKPRWYPGQTLNQADVRDIQQYIIERSSLQRCCRDHVDEISALEAKNERLSAMLESARKLYKAFEAQWEELKRS